MSPSDHFRLRSTPWPPPAHRYLLDGLVEHVDGGAIPARHGPHPTGRRRSHWGRGQLRRSPIRAAGDWSRRSVCLGGSGGGWGPEPARVHPTRFPTLPSAGPERPDSSPERSQTSQGHLDDLRRTVGTRREPRRSADPACDRFHISAASRWPCPPIRGLLDLPRDRSRAPADRRESERQLPALLDLLGRPTRPQSQT